MGLMVHSLPDAHVCGKLSCGSCSQVLTTPKHPCDRFILIYLVAEVRHLESGHRSYHLCWNGKKPKLPAPLQFTQVLVLQLCLTLPARLLCPWSFPSNKTGVGCHSLLQEIFPTQGSSPGLPHDCVL